MFANGLHGKNYPVRQITHMSDYLYKTGMSYNEALGRFKSITTATRRAWLARMFVIVARRREKDRILKECAPRVLEVCNSVRNVGLHADSLPTYVNTVKLRCSTRQNNGKQIKRVLCSTKPHKSKFVFNYLGQGKAYGAEVGSLETITKFLIAARHVLSCDDLIRKIRLGGADFVIDLPGEDVFYKGRGTVKVRFRYNPKCVVCSRPSVETDIYKSCTFDLCEHHIRPKRRTYGQNSLRWNKRRFKWVVQEHPQKAHLLSHVNFFPVMEHLLKISCASQWAFYSAVLNDRFLDAYDGIIRFRGSTPTRLAVLRTGKESFELPRGLDLKSHCLSIE